MSVDQLFACLADRGVQLYLDGDRLRFKAPVGALTKPLRDGITTHRTTIIERIKSGVSVPKRCSYCDWRSWNDEPPKDGRIRTTCGKCGKFIGYRPHGGQGGRN
ncbi:MAG: hypothetical protein AB7L90_26670 [Hyphomicrobiaceae bacterium]